jgi:ATP-binding protein involved in chromosome partitioning
VNASTPTRDAIDVALREVIDPELRRNVVDLDMVGGVEIDESGRVEVNITLTTPACPLKGNLRDQVVNAVGKVAGVTAVEVTFGAMSPEQRTELKTKLRGAARASGNKLNLPEGCRVIAVASGKGGVGKSTVTANLAVALAARGIETAVVDADVYGYSIPQMLGVKQRPVTVDGLIVPPVSGDVRCMSIGFFLDDNEPVMWRGPMLHRALEQFLSDVHWGDTQVLVIDMPPGTGDVALSLGQLLPRAEVLVVTTPQRAAQDVAVRAARMAQKLDQRVIGVVENMSGSGAESIFGEGGGDALAAEIKTEVLARVPLDRAVREGGDSGTPVAHDTTSVASAFHELAERVLAIAPPTAPPPAPADRIKQPLAML